MLLLRLGIDVSVLVLACSSFDPLFVLLLARSLLYSMVSLHLMASAPGLVFVVPVGVVLALACSSFDSLSFGLVLARSLLYSMASAPGFVLARSSCLSALCWWCRGWRVHYSVRWRSGGVGPFILYPTALAMAPLLACSLSCWLVACNW